MSILCSMVGASFTVAAAAVVIRRKLDITAVGNAQVDTAQSKFGGASALFDGTGDYLVVQSNPLPTSGSFTVEFWLRPSALSGIKPVWSNRDTGGTNRGVLYLSGAGLTWWNGDDNLNYSGSLTVNTWHHIACVKDGSTRRLFVDGAGMVTDSGGYVAGDLFQIGRADYSGTAFSSELPGHIDEFRVSNSARYTTTFTPSTTPFVNDDNTIFLLHADGTDASTFFDDDNGVRASRALIAQGNAQVDTAQSKFGGSALLCDGTGDYLLSPQGPQWDFGTSSFTIEYFIRFNAINTLYVPIGLRASGAINNGEWWCEITAAENKMYWGFKNFAGTTYYVNLALAGTAFATGQWYHIALVNNAGTAQMYVNGTATGATSALSGSFGISTTDLWVGAGAGAYSLNGWMDEIRISNTARYTTTFTPTTTPFVNDANTLLLIHADGTDGSTVFLDDNSGVPTTAPTTAVTFDGNEDYYSATGLTTTATDGKYMTFAFTFYLPSSATGKFMDILAIELGGGSNQIGFFAVLQSTRLHNYFTNSAGSTGQTYGDFEITTSNVYHQIVYYHDATSFSNCKYYVDGVDRTTSLLNGPSFGEPAISNVNFNWGATGAKVYIGNGIIGTGFDASDEFDGRISQLYIHNASGAPDINKFWYFGSNRPRDLGTNGTATGLAQPLIYHYGSTSTFATNNGTGFNSYTLTLNGNIATGNGPNYA